MDLEIRALVVLVITKISQMVTVLYSVYAKIRSEQSDLRTRYVKPCDKEYFSHVPSSSQHEPEINMKTQQVGVDFWAMGKSMLTYGALTALCWVMLRLFSAVFTLPRRMRQQQQTIQESLQELQRRFPDLNITEEDLMNAENELDELVKDHEENGDKDKQLNDTEENQKEKQVEETETKELEDKKTI